MSWLIFVDTNILLDFYRLGGESASRQLNALERHKDAIITCDQVRMEFMKNRPKVILDSLKNLGKPNKPSMPPIISDTKSARLLLTYVEEATKRHTSVRTKIEKILQDPSHHDPVYRVLNRIFGHSGSFNLKRPNKTRYQIRSLARKRFLLRYPPRKQHDTCIGDAINWEWIVHCAHKATKTMTSC